MKPNLRQLFFEHVGQTSDFPMGLEVERAEGVWLLGPNGKKWIDLISGVSVSNVGHNNPAVIEAVCSQARDYLHLMVYGEVLRAWAAAAAEEYGPQGAYEMIDRLRRRVGMVTLTESLPNLTKETMRALIRNERRVELFHEGQRAFDVVYAHGETAFAAGAKAAGCTFADGGGMLVAQAVATVQAVCDVSGIDCELSFDELFEIMANAAGFNV